MKTELTIGDSERKVTVELDRTAGVVRAVIDGRTLEAEAIWLNRRHLLLSVDGRSHDVEILPAAGDADAASEVDVYLGGHALRVRFPDPTRGKTGGRKRKGAGRVTATMPGKVVALLVEVGDEVAAGQAVVVVEAMKMENELQASVAGTVKSIDVAAGDIVKSGAMLLEIEPC